ncbi:phosphonate ABC transporter, permease protein PhnE [Corynebacterium sp. A21]|uniref:phosphonate ABC transporter, permease protein PhnE n=1 Tax=Corynebacterium sp. A21 TaxID=3457318 RepID=UPI003FD10259
MTTSLSAAPRSSATQVPTKPRPSLESNLLRIVLLVIFAAAAWSVWDLKINLATFVDSFNNAVDFIADIFPLDFPSFGEILEATLTTLAIVFLATVLAVLLSIPLAVFAASNTTTGNGARLTSRALIVVTRAIPDLVLAILFFRIFGLGGLPGVLALGIGSIGMVAKLYADAIEQVDPGPSEALRAAGAGRAQFVITAIIPQLMPQLIATALHRFDVNLRASVILGYVGVTGIGMEISNSLNTRNYSEGIAWALIVLVLCLITEMVSGSARAALLGKDTAKSQGFYGVFWKSADRLRGRTTASAEKSGKIVLGYEVPRTPAGAIQVSPHWTAGRIRRVLYLVTLGVLVALAAIGADMFSNDPFSRLSTVPHTIGLFFPPSDGDLGPTLWLAMLETIQIGLAATLMGSVLSIPIGILAAKNVSGSARVQGFFRGVIVCIRAIPDLILAIILIVITGLGPVPGAIALAIGSIGLLSKLLADSIEETDTDVQEALRANGANRTQVFFTATFRQAMPSFVAHVIYQLDNNIRAATLLGIVGAGGIGFYLLNASRVMAFDTVTYMLIMIIAVTLALEGLSMWARRVVR